MLTAFLFFLNSKLSLYLSEKRVIHSNRRSYSDRLWLQPFLLEKARLLSKRKREVWEVRYAVLGTGQSVNLRGPFRQGVRTPGSSTILAAKYFPANGGTVHPLGIALVKRQPKHGGLRLRAHIDAFPC
jgi:hypothetical protein